ncbi:twin-arginine translocation signal domain-containing protein, partial [Streptomyces sp. NPDC006333]
MSLNRRKFLEKSAVTGAGVALAGAVAAPSAQAATESVAGGRKKRVKRYSLTVMGTTDLHGHVFNWDYFKDAEYQDGAGNAQGLSRISTLVNAVRKEKGRCNTLLLDAGDT